MQIGAAFELRPWATHLKFDNVRSIMRARLHLAVSKKCDGVEPDNVDGYANHTGFPLMNQDQYNYNTFLASEAHLRNLAVALKNDVDQLSLLQPSFDFAVNEQCHELGELGGIRYLRQTTSPC
ncbi:endo alpha-1,4 polygalactosaminidase [Paraburkholderia xenovorans]|uniref:endo alpha-1,4 polygalactosaminidase n=1 Tax=Paraburkholderia xenovorans TaxID=36873 RepID=UPI0038B76B34